ncbi:hypothetical protein OUZ56_021141 [Daphnia magna]|uniref:Uncharacterized protein n=1 Tax=Daphnia magna TaxID=35525 RepID=A0ABQ9ZHY6_9CRUS|nr:hypothetical protein OUZ56_021141 [Daphnia magna]
MVGVNWMRLDSLVRVSLPLYLYPRMLGYAVRLSQRAGGRHDALAPFGQSTSILPTLGTKPAISNVALRDERVFRPSVFPSGRTN